jgi:hypothetical protein
MASAQFEPDRRPPFQRRDPVAMPISYLYCAPIEQHHKENRALRTETTINNTYDFGIGNPRFRGGCTIWPGCARSALRPIAGFSKSNV